MLFFLNYFFGTFVGKRGSGNPLRYPSAADYSWRAGTAKFFSRREEIELNF
jgi:hypothetical protein